MKKSFRIISIIVTAVVLTACGPKAVQPIQSLSGIETREFNLTNVNVELSPEFIARIEQQVSKEEDYIASQKERVANPSGRTSLRRKQNAEIAQKRVEETENRITSIKEETAAIETDVRAGIQEELANKFSGSRNINLDVSVNSFAMTNGGAVVLIGGSDSMTGLIKITDNQSNDLLGEYHITDLDTNAAGGLLGLMVRGGDPRGDMIRQFSEKISDVLSGKYID